MMMIRAMKKKIWNDKVFEKQDNKIIKDEDNYPGFSNSTEDE